MIHLGKQAFLSWSNWDTESLKIFPGSQLKEESWVCSSLPTQQKDSVKVDTFHSLEAQIIQKNNF